MALTITIELRVDFDTANRKIKEPVIVKRAKELAAELLTIAELTAAIQRNARGARWQEILTRLRLEPTVDAGELIETIADVQQALKALGHEPGPLDGYDGPRTRAAVRQFQEARGLAVDGIAGPITRAALTVALGADAP